MDNLWSFLYQTLAVSVAAAVLLIAKRLFLDKLSPRWQYGVWAILALRALVPAGLLGRTLVPGGQVVLEAARMAAEGRLSSALTDLYTPAAVTAPVEWVSSWVEPRIYKSMSSSFPRSRSAVSARTAKQARSSSALPWSSFSPSGTQPPR